MNDHRPPLHIPNRGDRFGGDPDGWRRTWVEESARHDAEERKTEAVLALVKFTVSFAVGFAVLNAVRAALFG